MPATAALNVSWAPIAPQSYTTTATGPAGGRILSVAVDPADATGNTVYLGTSGGVWRSTNTAAGASAVSFTPLTDQVPALHAFNAPVSVVSVGAVSVQPGGTRVVLAGTGDPTNRPDSIYGTGVLRSADDGQTWTAIAGSRDPLTGQTQNSFFGEAFTGFAWSTTVPDLVVAAVSSAGGATAVNAGYSTQSAMGLYYSSDAGQIWRLATITDGPNQEIQGPDIGVGAGAPALAVVWNPVRHIFVAALRSHGFYQSTDGMTWTRLATQPGSQLTTSNCPAGQGGGGSPSCHIYQAALAVQPGTGDTFAVFTTQSDGDQGMWQDVCAASGGACSAASLTFSRRIANTALETSSGIITGASHALSLQAVPLAGDTVLFAGTQDLFRCSLAAGCVWRNATNTFGNGCAAARVGGMQHQAAWLDGPGSQPILFFATDRGLWRSTDVVNQQQPACSPDDATHFDNLNGSLAATAEVTSVAQDPVDSSVMLAGEGTLGTAGGSNGAWQALLTGQGDGTAVGTGVSTGTWFATSGTGVSISACSLGAGCGPIGFGIQPVIGNTQVSGDGAQLRRPAVWMLDPQYPGRMIVGTCRVWRGPANGTNWAPSNALSRMLDGQPAAFCQSGNTQLRSLAATGTLTGSSGGQERIYAGLAGFPDGAQTAPGHIYRGLVTPASTAASTTWRDLTASPLTNATAGVYAFNPGGIAISSIAIDSTDATGSTLYVGIAGFGGNGFAEQANVSPIYSSVDAGDHWTNITSNLPNAPVNAVLVDPENPAIVYAATDVGVYVTTTITLCSDPRQSCWSLYGTGLPPVKVTSLTTSTAGGAGWLRIGTWGRGVWQTELASVALRAAAALAVTITPGTLSFAGQPVGTASATQTLTIQNTGQGAVTLGSATLSDADFSVSSSSCGATLATGASCSMAVVFAPTGIGVRSGTLTLPNNTQAGALSVALSGVGLQGSVIALTPLRMDFAAVLLGQTSPVQYLTIANTGTASTALQPLVISGPFRISANTCATALAPNSSCTVGIVFTPVASGAASGSLVATDDAGTQTALLSGTGQTGPSDVLSTTALSFGAQQLGTSSPQQQVTLTNTGDSALNGIVVNVTGDFTVANQCGASLPGHSTCALLVAYAPQALGAESGQLTIQDLVQQQTVALSGSGTAPPVAPPGGGSAGIATLSPLKIDFGVEGVSGISAAQTLTLINSGATVLSGIAVSASPGFSIVANACNIPLSPGASCTMGVAFAPQTPGAAAGTVQVSAATLASPVTIPLTGAAADFQLSVQGASSSTVVGGTAAQYQLLLTPVGASAGVVSLTCSGAPAGSTCTANPATVTMSGTGATATIALTIATAAQTANRQPEPPLWGGRSLPALAMASLLPLLWGGRRKNRRLRQHCAMLVLILGSGLLCLGTVGCGLAIHGGGAVPATTPSGSGSAQGSYTVTIGASAPGLVRAVSVNLIVE